MYGHVGNLAHEIKKGAAFVKGVEAKLCSYIGAKIEDKK